jgi:putative membrane protein
MIKDHGETTSELKSLALEGDLKMTLPTELDSTHQGKIDKLKALKGGDFSAGYQLDQVSGHKDAVSLFERYAKGGDDPKLKEWADKTLPALRHHLQMAQELASGKTVGKN